MFHIIGRLAVEGRHPVNAAELVIHAIFFHIIISMSGEGAVFLIAQHLIASGEEPENAGVKYHALIGFFIERKVVPLKAVKTAEFLIFEFFPIGNDMVFQFVSDLVYEHFKHSLS